MHRVRSRLTMLVFVIAGATLVAGQQPIRVGSSTVAVYATVTDGDGRLVPDLKQEDFEVFDNGKKQEISLFASESQPISVVVMLDRSGSMRQNFRFVERATAEFVQKLQPVDKARIGSFADQIQIDPAEFTPDHQKLLGVLRSSLQPSGPTPLWNATNQAIEALDKQDGRRVVLLFTDGGDNPGNFRMNNLSVMDVMKRANDRDVMVYAIGLASGGGVPMGRPGGMGGGFGSQGPDPGLPTIASETGGGYFELNRADALGPTFARVAEELHRQYAIGFAPEKLDGKTHKLQVKVKTPGAKVRARKYYLAAKESESQPPAR